MATRKVTPENLGAAINDILTDYAETVVRSTNEAVEETGKMAVKIAQSYATRIGRGKYAKSLSMEKTDKAGRVSVGTSVTIYSKQYRIAHLLEHGHVVKNKSGEVVGNARAFPHFTMAEAMAESTLPAKIEQAIRGA